MSGRHLPPVYVDIQEEIEQNLDEINTQSKYYQSVNQSQICLTSPFLSIVKSLHKLHMQRIKDSFFSDSETLQMKTLEQTRSITNLIKHSDLKLKELSRAETTESSSE